MSTRTGTPGITFAVQQVERATEPLPTCKTHEAFNRLLGGKVQACCEYTSDCIQKMTVHPLLAARRKPKAQSRFDPAAGKLFERPRAADRVGRAPCQIAPGE